MKSPYKVVVSEDLSRGENLGEMTNTLSFRIFNTGPHDEIVGAIRQVTVETVPPARLENEPVPVSVRMTRQYAEEIFLPLLHAFLQALDAAGVRKPHAEGAPSVEQMVRNILTQAVKDELLGGEDYDPPSELTSGDLVGCANLLSDYLAEYGGRS